MTKFILFGGSIYKASDGGQSFCDEFVKGFDAPVKILDCIFARPEGDWREQFKKDKAFFEEFLKGKFETNLATTKDFVEQMRWADAIYFKGGSTTLLMETLEQCPGWEKEIDGKTVAGGSAGANFFAVYGHSRSQGIVEGFGILPIKVLPHYLSDYTPELDWNKIEQIMRERHPELPLYCLREGEYRVIEV